MKGTKRPRPVVTTDGDGVVSHAGSYLLVELADRVGLTAALSRELACLQRRRRAHDPGEVLRDLAVSIADGGDCLSDLTVLHNQPDLFEEVASIPTAWRVIDALATDLDLAPVRWARAQARAHAWKHGVRPDHVTLDIDATLVTAHSDKQGAAGTYKRGYGFHPLLCSVGETGEILAGLLRPGNAGANTAGDHIRVLDAALGQLPRLAESDPPMLARADSAGATHDFLDALRERGLLYSVGFDLTERVREAVLALSPDAWVPAITQDGDLRDGAAVAELHDLELSAWPAASRAICRRERPHPGAQLSFTDHDGFRFQVFITDQADTDLAAAGGGSPRPRPGRGPHPLRQGVGAAQPALSRLRGQRGLARAGAYRQGPGGLDEAPLPDRRGRPLGTEAPQLLPLPRRCQPRAERATAVPASGALLALGADFWVQRSSDCAPSPPPDPGSAPIPPPSSSATPPVAMVSARTAADASWTHPTTPLLIIGRPGSPNTCR